MALLYFYDATQLDKQQLTDGLQGTDHHWEYVDDDISLENINDDTEVLSVFVTSKVTREIIERLPKLKLIACRSTGFNNVDLSAAVERGVTVVNVPTYGEATVAEHTFALLLSLTRKLRHVLIGRSVKPDELSRGHDIAGKTIAVIGTGHIGTRVIRIARGFDMKVLAYDPVPNQDKANELGFEYGELHDILPAADVVTLHVPYLPSTHHLIDAEKLGIMKEGAFFINTARGEIVDTKALIQSLESGHLEGAALDVLEGENLLDLEEEIHLLRKDMTPANTLKHSVEIMALERMPNVIITPHNAFNTVEAIERINRTTVANIVNYWTGEIPNKITPPPITTGKLIIVRHAESDWNATGQWSGTRDIHLSEKGFHEAGQYGRKFGEIGITIDYAFCSEQIRTRETLEGILDASGQFEVDIERVAALNERDYGDYTGKNKWEMKELIGEEAWDGIRRGWDVGIPNGETLKMVYERVQPFYINTILPLLKQGKNVLIVAHGNSIRALLKYIESISDEGVSELEMLFGQILVYETDELGKKLAVTKVSIDTTPPPA